MTNTNVSNKVLLPLLITLTGFILPVIMENIKMPGQVSSTGSTVEPPTLDLPGVDEETRESIDLDPAVLDDWVMPGIDFQLEDMAYAYSTVEKKNYVIAAGKQWVNAMAGGSNTTWAFVLFEIDETSTPNLVFRAWWNGSTSHNSAWSSVVIADFDKNGEPEIVFGGNITIGSQTFALYRRYPLRYGLYLINEWQNAYGSWSTTVLDMEAADVDGNGYPDLVVNTRASYTGNGDRSIMYTFPYLSSSNYNPAGWNNFAYDAGLYSAVWNEMKIADIDFDTRSEIVLGGFIQKAFGSAKIPAYIVLNFAPSVYTVKDFRTLDDQGREVVKEVDFSNYQMGINPDGIDGWNDVSTGYYNDIETLRLYGDHREVLQFSDPDVNGNALIRNSFLALGNVRVEFDLAIDDTTATSVHVDFYTSVGELKLELDVTGGWLFGSNFDWGLYDLGHRLEGKRWYTITVDYDSSTGFYKVWVNGHAIYQPLFYMSTSSTLLGSVQFSTSGASANNCYCIDNLRVYDLRAFSNSEIASVDLADMNGDGLLDIISAVNHQSVSSGNYSVQVVSTTRLLSYKTDNFKAYTLQDGIDGQGYWTSVNGPGCTSKVKGDPSEYYLELQDSSNISAAEAWWELPGVLPETGVVSFRAYTTSSTRGSYFMLGDGIWSEAMTEIVSTESTGGSDYPDMVFDQGGTLHVVWHDNTNYLGCGTDYDIFYKQRLPDGTWTTTEVVSTESTLTSYFATVAVDDTGTVHVVWYDGTNYLGCGTDYDIFYKQRLPGGTWTTTEIVSTESTGSSTYPSIYYKEGTVHVAWSDVTDYLGCGTDNDIFYKQRLSSGTWTTTEVVSTESTGISTYPFILVDEEDTVHVVWQDNTDYSGSGTDNDIFYKQRLPGGLWTVTEVASTESTGASYIPVALIDDSNTLHVVWYDGTNYMGSGTDNDIFYKQRAEDGTWTITEVVSTESSSSSYYPFIDIDTTGTFHVAWQDLTNYLGCGTDYDIFYKQRTEDGTWTITEVISTESTLDSNYPVLHVDESNNVHVVWSDATNFGGSGTDRDIFYKRLGISAAGSAKLQIYGGSWWVSDAGSFVAVRTATSFTYYWRTSSSSRN